MPLAGAIASAVGVSNQKNEFTSEGHSMSAEQLKMLADQYALSVNNTAPTVQTPAAAKARNELHAAIDALTSTPAQQGGEVVAWLIVDSDGVKVMLLGANEYASSADDIAAWANANRYTIRPLVYGDAVQPVGAVDEGDLWGVLDAATEAIDRVAVPHAYLSIAWQAGHDFIEKRRERLAAAPTPPAAEPVDARPIARVHGYYGGHCVIIPLNTAQLLPTGMALYTHPPASPADAIPAGWVPLRIEFEPGYPEDVAFGPQRMMDRLKKWLDKFYELLTASPADDHPECPDISGYDPLGMRRTVTCRFPDGELVHYAQCDPDAASPADAVDAARYRFLSSNDANCDNARTYEQGQRIAEMWDLFASPHIATKSELDAIIDAAMGQGDKS